MLSTFSMAATRGACAFGILCNCMSKCQQVCHVVLFKAYYVHNNSQCVIRHQRQVKWFVFMCKMMTFFSTAWSDKHLIMNFIISSGSFSARCCLCEYCISPLHISRCCGKQQWPKDRLFHINPVFFTGVNVLWPL